MADLALHVEMLTPSRMFMKLSLGFEMLDTPPNLLILANPRKKLSDWMDSEAINKKKINFIK